MGAISTSPGTCSHMRIAYPLRRVVISSASEYGSSGSGRTKIWRSASMARQHLRACRRFLQGTVATLLYDPAPTPLGWRSWFGAWYAEDAIRVSPNFTLSLGFRDEFTNGWNEALGRAATYTFTNGIISTQPNIGDSAFTVNHGKFLAQPRAGVAWSPLGDKRTVVRAGFGMYNDLQDALGYRTDQNAPFDPTYSLPNLPVSQLPISPDAAGSG